MHRIVHRSCWSIMLVVLCAESLHAQESRPSQAEEPAASQPEHRKPRRVREQDLQALFEKERPALEARGNRIGAELAAMDRAALKDDDWAKEWAGTYYTGDGLGMNVSISLAPKSGLVYTWHGCLGLYDANHGDIVEAFPGGIKVKFAIDPEASQYQMVSETIYFVRWGDRRYLVPESLMLDFVNEYNEGGYSRSSMFKIPLKEGRSSRQRYLDPEALPEGRPKLPEKYAQLILHPPLTLTVTRIATEPLQHLTGEVYVSKSTIGFNHGLDAGVYLGMEFGYESGSASGSFKIDWISHDACSGTLTLFVGKAEKLVLPQVGFKVVLPGIGSETNKHDEPAATQPNR